MLGNRWKFIIMLFLVFRAYGNYLEVSLGDLSTNEVRSTNCEYTSIFV